MALCDQLEAARAESEAGRDKLTAATLARLNAPDPETFANDARFALDNLEPLTQRTDQIKQLRQTILNLAVLGKLVEQDPNDEPAAPQIRRVSEARHDLIRMQLHRSERHLDGVRDVKMRSAIPTEWVCARMEVGAVCAPY